MADPILPITEPVQPLGLVGSALQPVPDLSSALRPIDPLAREKVPLLDPWAEFSDAPPLQQDAPDPFNEFVTADDLDVKSVAELDSDRENFHPSAYFRDTPNAAQDPAKLKKLVDVYRKRREEGLTASGVIKAAVKETPGLVADIGGGIKRLGERAIDLTVQPVANVLGSVVTGDIFDGQKRKAFFDEAKRNIKTGAAEVSAGTESATAGLLDLSRQGLRKLREPTAEMVSGVFTGKKVNRVDQSDQELLAELSADAEFQRTAEDILKGGGETAKIFGLDKETLAKEGVTLDEEAIQQLSLVDPISMVMTGGAFKLVGLGGKVLGTTKTLAGAKYATEKLAEIAKYSSGKLAKGAGRVLSDVGKAAEGRTFGALGIASPLITGDLSGLAIATGVKYIGGPIARKTGGALTQLGKEIAEDVPRSANFQKLLDIVAVPTKVATTLGEGAVKGVVAAAPFAIAAETDEQAGALLGAGGAIGAAGAVGAGAFRVVKNSAARRYFGENRPVLENVPSPGYGRDAGLDTQHEAGVKKLSAQNASELNNFREILRSQNGEIYAVDQPTFRQKVADEYRARTGQELTPDQLDRYQKNHAFFDETNGDKKVVYLNSDTTGLHHDAGHIFDALLSQETRNSLDTAIAEAFPKEKIDAFRKLYSERLGDEISPAKAKDEFRAEQFAALFNNVPVTELNAPKGLLNKFIDVMAEGADGLGIDLSAGATTPNLGAPVSVGIRKLFQNAAGEVTRQNVETKPVAPPLSPEGPALAPAPTPAPPAPAPAPAPIAPAGRNIRVTPEQVVAFKQQASPEIRAAAAARAAETGVDYARSEAKKNEGSPTSQVIERISDSMESGAPVVGIKHLGITSVGTPEGPIGATLRKAEQAGGYAALNAAQLDVRQNAPPEIVSQHSKNFVPVRWDAQGGSPTLIAMSLDKVISNILRIAADKTARDLIPYAVENGKLTPDGWREVVADAQAYSENQANGRKGNGGRLEVPEAGLSIPAENPAYTPQILTPERANFQNLVQGLAPPKTSRAQKGVMPANIKGQLLAEANKRAIEIPAKIPTKQAGKQAFVGFSPRVVQEVNPLRNEMVRRGVRVQDLLEVTERIRAKDIVSATPKPEINYKAPVTDIIRGGFLPAPTEFRQKSLGGRTVEEFSKYILDSPSKEWIEAVGNMTGGQTGGSWNLGLGLKDRGDLAVLQKYQAESSAKSKGLMEKIRALGKDAPDELFTEFQTTGTKSMFFREAYEAATNTGSAKAAFASDKMGFSVARSPFPIESTSTESPK